MTLISSILGKADFAEYAHFIERSKNDLIYHQIEYIKTIANITNSDTPTIIVVRRHSNIVGSIVFLTSRSDIGLVANSLPYYGSHGDILIDDDEQDKSAVACCIADFVAEYIHTEDFGAVNIVSHPLDSWIGRVAPRAGLRAWDRRIGQISELPEQRDPEAALNGILANCNQKTRNLVRKGLRQNFEISTSDSPEDWDQAIAHHRLGMERIGGRAKTRDEFDAIRAGLTKDHRRKLFIARKDGEFAGSLLNLYHKDWVEYFTPVATDKFRSDQVLSAIIAHAMIDACVAGRRWWNWGGTWTTQAGVYHFKQGWGAIDHPYTYYGTARAPGIITSSPAELIAQFPLFYVKPFDMEA
jgi:hypothetical protein